ncbi:hypothetical protein GCM10009841_05150 [Microlunatus panaciterrae]
MIAFGLAGGVGVGLADGVGVTDAEGVGDCSGVAGADEPTVGPWVAAGAVEWAGCGAASPVPGWDPQAVRPLRATMTRPATRLGVLNRRMGIELSFDASGEGVRILPPEPSLACGAEDNLSTVDTGHATYYAVVD